MVYFAGIQALKGLFFMSTFKGKETLHAEAEMVKNICARNNIFIEDTVIEPQPLDMMDIDRPYIRGLVKLVCEGGYNVLVLRNMYDISMKKTDWENFINLMQQNGISVYLVERGTFIFNNYEES